MTKQTEPKRSRKKSAAPAVDKTPPTSASLLERQLARHGGPLWLRHTHCLLGVVGSDGIIIEANDALANLLAPAQPAGHPLTGVFVEPNRERLTGLLARTFTPDGVAPEWQNFHVLQPGQKLPTTFKCGFLPLPRRRALLYAEPVPPLDARTAEEYFQVNSELATLTRELQKTRFELERRTRDLDESRQRIQELTTTDELTALPNRHAIQARLNEEVIRASRYDSPLAVILLDLDQFKQINDMHGQQVGDRVLRQVAVHLREGLRSCDLIGRFGGEEFLAILPQTGLQDALMVADRLRDTLERKPNVIHFSLVITVTASLGVALLHPREGDTIDMLLERADKALSRAKHNGRNRVELEESFTPPPGFTPKS